MVCQFETSLCQGEPSRINEVLVEEEELVDYEHSPNHEVTPIEVIPESANVEKVDDDATSSEMVDRNVNDDVVTTTT